MFGTSLPGSDSITAVKPCAALTGFALLVASTLPLQAQWPQFRGPTGDGTTSATALPLKWGEGQNVRWKTAVHGRAWSSPVIVENRIWMTTATEDGHDLFVVAVDPSDGRILRDIKLFHI